MMMACIRTRAAMTLAYLVARDARIASSTLSRDLDAEQRCLFFLILTALSLLLISPSSRISPTIDKYYNKNRYIRDNKNIKPSFPYPLQ
jgi:hypothetical protein